MTEKKSQSFWTTIPGILTGLAALTTATAGLIGALAAAGLIGGSGGTQEPAAANGAAPTATPTVQAAAPTATPTRQPDNPPTSTPAPVETVSGGNGTSSVNVTGTWQSDEGDVFTIFDSRGDVTIQVFDPLFGTVTMFGRREGNLVTASTTVFVDFQTLPIEASLRLSADGRVLDGTLSTIGVSELITLRRLSG